MYNSLSDPATRTATLENRPTVTHWQSIPAALERLTGAQNGSKKTEVEFIHTSNSGWPLGSSAAVGLTPAEWRRTKKKPIRISVLDSSFNPPTKAHLALASSSLPWKCPGTSQLASGNTPKAPRDPPDATEEMKSTQVSKMGAYDAHMLLLSVTNAEKKLKPRDATYQQRLEMMTLLSEEMESHIKGNLCVAAIDEPTFVGKSRKLRRAVARQLSSLSDPEYSIHVGSLELETLGQDRIRADWEREVNLCFVLGFDTVTRLFDPRFYESIEAMRESLRLFFAPTSDGGDGSCVVCARRTAAPIPTAQGEGHELKLTTNSSWNEEYGVSAPRLNQEELQFFQSAEVKDYWENGKVSLMEDLGSELQRMSSTLARIVDATTPGGRDTELRRLLPSSIMQYVLHQELYIETRVTS